MTQPTQLSANDSIVSNRFEILFVYDVEEGNPNGDPLNQDRPRVDEVTGENIVTDVRLKRTVRDYFIERFDNADGNGVFVRSAKQPDGTLKTREQLIKDELATQDMDIDDASKQDIKQALFKQFLGLRLFGATLAVEGTSIGQTGPTQFKMGRSFHEVDTRYIQQSVTLPSEEGAEQGTFADRYDLPYSLIRFHGLINENNAEETGLTYNDVALLADGLWSGTRSLITHSKMEHEPQLLLFVEYGRDNYHIGGLDNLIDIDSEKDDIAIRSFSDVTLETNALEERLRDQSDNIVGVHAKTAPGVSLDLPVPTREFDIDQ